MNSLFDLPTTIQERFERFDSEHPDVWTLFVRFANELIKAGCEPYSADAILHRIRWHYATSGIDASGFKMNNDFSSRYARKLANADVRFKDFFETRVLKS